MVKHGSNAVDVYVGNQIKLRRLRLNQTQEDLGTAIGMTFHMVQRYENGIYRIPVSALVAFARALECQPSDLLAGAAGVKPNSKVARVQLDAIDMQLAKYFSRINSEAFKRSLLAAVRAYLVLQDGKK